MTTEMTIAEKIHQWNRRDVSELRDLLRQLPRDQREVDLSALPTCPIPEDIDTSAPIWALDEQGNLLVGDEADDIAPLSEWRSQ